MEWASKTLCYRADFNEGHVIQENDLIELRCATGVDLRHKGLIRGMRLVKSVKSSSGVSMGDFGACVGDDN